MAGLKVGDIYATLGINTTQFDGKLNRARGQLGGLASQLGSATGSTSGLAAGMGSVAGKVAGAVAAVTAITALGGAAMMAAGNLEQTRIAFTSMLGSAEKAEKFIGEMRKFADVTPFEFTDLAVASRRLLAFGFAAESIIPMMRDIGDSVAAMGGSSEMIDRVTRAIGQMKAKGKVSAEEMMQLSEAGIPGWKYLAAAIGKTTAETMKLSEQGKISADVAIDALMKGMQGDFGGMMEKQSKTFLGRWSTLKDRIATIFADIGTPLIAIAGRMLDAFQPVLDLIAKAAKWLAGDHTKESWLIAIAKTIKSAWVSLKPAFTSLVAAAKELWVTLQPVLKGLAAVGIQLWITQIKLLAVELRVLAQALKIVIQLVTWQFQAQQAIVRGFFLLAAKILDILGALVPKAKVIAAAIRRALAESTEGSGPTGNPIQDMMDFYTGLAEQMQAAQEDAAAAAQAAADAEVAAVQEVIEKRRQAAEELRQQTRQAMGFTGILDLWHSAMVAGVRGTLGKAREGTSANDVPQVRELREIREQLRKQEKATQDTNALIRERLGVFA